MICRCDHPQIYLHGLDREVRCSTCGGHPRDDLGGADDRARLAYRVRLNKLRDEAVEQSSYVRPKGGRRKMETTRAWRVAAAKLLREEGLTYAAIGDRLGVTASTVQFYLRPDKYERQKERARKRGKMNPSDRRQWARQYRERNREQLRAYNREYKRRKRAEQTAEDRERRNRYQREYRARAAA